ncbi:hypothetical protein [Roseivirga sp.]|uniref:hypothetical protein n=1 Tax=Roseivirga sp. TaxID=1964215 RepID=UPI003B8DC20D
MKKSLFLLFFTFISSTLSAQWLGTNPVYFNSGKVGIGTSSPIQKLQVHGNIYAVGGVFYADNNFGLRNSLNDYGVYPYSTYLQFRYNGNEAMRINSSGNIGIGTNSPIQKLQVHGNIYAVGGVFYTDNNFGLRNSLNDYGVYPYSTYLQFRYNGNEAMRISSSGNVGIGTTSPGNKLDVNGTIRSKKVKVEASGWPDYVFSKNYELRSLNELERYIQENQHLPEVPSESEIEVKGLDLGAMDATLLKKVEELTLYLIQESKEKDKLKKENMELKETLQSILKRLEKLESK